jgi:hypothetical protein
MNKMEKAFRNLKKWWQSVLGVMFITVFLTPHSGISGTSNESTCSECVVVPGVLRLYPKDPHTWEIVSDAALAHLEFSREKETFRLSAHKLKPDTPYALIQHEHDYPTGSGYIIATANSDSQGRLILQGGWKLWKGKFWLVLHTDVEGEAGDYTLDRLKEWNPESYLFEARVL